MRRTDEEKLLTINRNIKRKLVKLNMIIIPAQPQTIKTIQHNLTILYNLYYILYYHVLPDIPKDKALSKPNSSRT